MDDPTPRADDEAGASVSVRWPELAFAALLIALSLLVITDSVRIGIGWADDGPKSGYFPFYIGLLMLVSSSWVLVAQLRRARANDPVFAERTQLRSVASMLVPIAVYVAAIQWLGIYLASFLLIAYFMKRVGRYGIPLTALISLGVPVAFFLVFERWFLVPLPKGPLERMLGF